MFICDCGNADFEKCIFKGIEVYMCTKCRFCYNAKYLEEIKKGKNTSMPNYFKWKSAK